MIRNILAYILVIVFIILAGILFPFGYVLERISPGKGRNMGFFIAKVFLRIILFVAGIRVQIKGAERLPKENALYVMNHQSHMDPLVLLAYFPKNVSYIAKKEIGKLPIVFQWMKLIDCLFMDRDDIRQSLKVIQAAQKLLEEGKNVGVFPEGTRSEDGNLLPFKPGSIKMALKAQSLIVPVMINGTTHVMKKGSLRLFPNRATIEILPAISKAQILGKDTTAIIGEIEEQIKNALSR